MFLFLPLSNNAGFKLKKLLSSEERETLYPPNDVNLEFTGILTNSKTLL